MYHLLIHQPLYFDTQRLFLLDAPQYFPRHALYHPMAQPLISIALLTVGSISDKRTCEPVYHIYRHYVYSLSISLHMHNLDLRTRSFLHFYAILLFL